MTTSGTGVYFDGQTSRRQDVHVAIEGALSIYRADGARLLQWPFEEVRELAAPSGVLRLGREGGPPLARLEIRDPELQQAIRAATPKLGATIKAESGTTRKVVLWSLAAVVSLTVFCLYGIPAIATAATPLLPWSVDVRMGKAGDEQLRMFVPTRAGEFECGAGSQERPGREALDRMAKRLSDEAGLPVPVTIIAVRSDFVNALALPGSPIYLFDGLIQKARSADEIAGVLAHEIGHVANRDGTRRAISAGGASLILGFVLGDVVGGAATVAIVQALADASYSRDAERDADLYSVRLMKRLGADAGAMGGFLTRMTDEDDEPEQDEKDKKPAETKPSETNTAEKGKDGKSEGEGKAKRGDRGLTDWLSSHPASVERRRTIEAAAGNGPVSSIVDKADFLAIKRICGQPQ